MDILGQKLPYFDKWKIKDQSEFLAVLVPFVKKLPADHKFG
jgi:hypothetical protein